MAVHVQDDFNRANSTTSLGVPVAGGPYSVVSGTWGILSNEAYLSTASSGAQVTFPGAINIDISCKVPIAQSGTVQTGLIIRRVDVNNYWLLQGRAGFTTLYRCNAGVFTAVADAPLATNDVMGLKAYGDQIAVYVAGKQYLVIPDHWFSTAAPTAGLRNGGTASGRWDDLLVQDQLAPVGSWGEAPQASVVNPGLEMGATNALVASAVNPGLEVGAVNTLTTSLYKGRNTALEDEMEIP